MKSFIKNIENFTCEVCNTQIIGTGYTNHCPNCLWSKHVDINPGDRQNTCLGLMKPISAIYKSNKYVLVHQCQNCQQIKKNKSLPNDNQELLIKLSGIPIPAKI